MSEASGAAAKFDPSIRINQDTCHGCGACVTACPVDVIRLDPVKGKAFVAYPADCCVCFLCQDDCPTGSATVDHNAGNPRLRSIYDTMDIPLPEWAK